MEDQVFKIKGGLGMIRAMSDVSEERRRQDEQWGVQNHHPAYWLAILGKQVGQLGSAILQREWWEDKDASLGIMRKEAVQAAAVAIALIEAIDKGDMPVGLVTAKPGDPRLLSRVLGTDDEAVHSVSRIEKCYHCELPIEYDPDEDAWFHISDDDYQDWLRASPRGTEHNARYEPTCKWCGRDNANGTHHALERSGHLNHMYAAVRP